MVAKVKKLDLDYKGYKQVHQSTEVGPSLMESRVNSDGLVDNKALEGSKGRKNLQFSSDKHIFESNSRSESGLQTNAVIRARAA